MSSTLDRVKEIIVDHLDVDSDEIQMDSNFRDDLNADSLGPGPN